MTRISTLATGLMVSIGLFASTASSYALDNGSFEDGLNGWTVSDPGLAATITEFNTIDVDSDDGDPNVTFTPVDGFLFAGIVAELEDVATTISQTFTGAAGDVFTGWFAFVTEEDEDDVPPNGDYNDVGFVEIFDGLVSTTLLAFSSVDVQPGNSTPWTKVAFILPSDGSYTLTIGVTNIGDDSKPSGVFMDALSVTAVPGPIAGAGLPVLAAFAGLMAWRRRPA